MIGYLKAKKILEKSKINIGLQNVSFLDSLNRISAENIYSKVNYPAGDIKIALNATCCYYVSINYESFVNSAFNFGRHSFHLLPKHPMSSGLSIIKYSQVGEF